MKRINPMQVFGSELCAVQNPSSYIGGEIGAIVKPHADEADGQGSDLFNFAIAFPDVYSIGMSNQAIKIIYNGLNQRPSVRCERVFAVETDFESLLRKKNVPLYTLETGMPLHQVDMVGFSIGYELGITGVLNILDLGRIPILKKDRTENDPIVIAGGVGATNPAAFSAFFDAVFIGEAEGGMFDLVAHLADVKKQGANRSSLLAELARHPSVWTEGMTKESCGHTVARRAIQEDFGLVPSVPSFLPLPNIKTVQDHGVVEIMRGCPNGCRFCHAGIYYRPQRIKTKELIFAEIDRLVTEAGYREISLTSLSSADYPDIGGLLDELNQRYHAQNVSFQLPSLKVNSFTLPILEQLSEVRKSGLTLAVETPEEAWQLRLNKEVYAQHLIAIITEAKKRGWNKAKFYFMVGLPFPETDGKTEESVIVDFLRDIQEKTRIQCNVNVGTFIPKPHTPYQWVRQISPAESERKLTYIREHLPRGKFHVSTHDVSTSYLEGLLSRGDGRASAIIYNAYQKGCRLDAWEDHLRANLPLWEAAFAEAGYDVKAEILRERSHDEPLPWDSVSLGPAKSFYLKEWQKNLDETLTPKCAPHCDHRCGVCNNKVSCRNEETKNTDVTDYTDENTHRGAEPAEEDIKNIYQNVYKNIQLSDKMSYIVQKNAQYKDANLCSSVSSVDKNQQPAESALSARNKKQTTVRQTCNIPMMYRAIFSFAKQDGGEFISHLGQVEMFNRAILTSELPVVYTAGFNPLPRLEFASTLSLGVVSRDEIASVLLYDPISEQDFMDALNPHFVRGIHINRCFIFPITNQRRRESLSSGLWGNVYEYRFFGEEKRRVLDFFASEHAAPFVEDALCAFEQHDDTLIVKLVFKQDRPFRTALETFFGKKTYEFVSITKLQTLAKPDIIGWTDEMNATYNKTLEAAKQTGTGNLYTVNAEYKKHILRPEDLVATQTAIPFFTLYERIAAINAALIRQRDERG